jgi:DNA-nicking Smr family endonuclease
MGKRRPTHVPPPELPPTLHGVVPDLTVDLHGMRTHQAQRRVESLLATCSQRPLGAVIRIVTGKGNRSSGTPVLLGLVEELLRDDPRVTEMVRDAGGGGWLIRTGP